MDLLKYLSHDRVTKVQIAAQTGLKVWEQCAFHVYQTEKQKTMKNVGDPRSAEELIDLRVQQPSQTTTVSPLKTEPNGFRFEHEKNPLLIGKHISELTKGAGWGANARGSNFVKKNSGQVGSKVFLNTNPSIGKQKPNSSHLEARKDMKDWIMKSRAQREEEREKLNRFEVLEQPENGKQEEENFRMGETGLSEHQKRLELDGLISRERPNLSGDQNETQTQQEGMNGSKGSPLSQELDDTIPFEDERSEEETTKERDSGRSRSNARDDGIQRGNRPANNEWVEAGGETKFNSKGFILGLEMQKGSSDDVTRVWIKALRLISEGFYDDAYKAILDTGDDLYLLRLMAKTGSVIDKLREEIAKRLLMRISKITQAHFIEMLALGFIKEGVSTGLISKMNQQQKSDLSSALGIMGSLGGNCGEAANKINSEILF